MSLKIKNLSAYFDDHIEELKEFAIDHLLENMDWESDNETPNMCDYCAYKGKTLKCEGFEYGEPVERCFEGVEEWALKDFVPKKGY